MHCPYCTPDKHGTRKTIAKDNFTFGSGSMKKFKSNIMKIRRKNKRYNLSVLSVDYIDGTNVMSRNNGLNYFAQISFCPFCGRDLSS